MRRAASRWILAVAALVLFQALPVRAGDWLEITEDIIARFFKSRQAESQATDQVSSDLAALDKKIADWRECARPWLAAGESGGAKLGMAAKLALKGKCGATSEEGFMKDRQKLLDGPRKAALGAGNFKEDQYAALTNRIVGFLSGGGGEFSDAEKAVLNAHRADLLHDLGSLVTTSTGSAGGGTGSGGMAMGGGGHIPASWAGDAAWGYIGYMYGIMYLSGATTFEKVYQPGEWTRWQMTDSSSPDEKTVIERAFLGKREDGDEWWRTKAVITREAKADTVILEALFKPLDPEGTMRQLVRMRGRFPGDTEAREMMVPQYMSMLSSSAALPFRPTPESVEGATVGTETIGGVSAKHVKYSGGGGNATIEWWLSDDVPGGWVKFVGTNPRGDDENPDTWIMELTDKGNGAKSELGVM